MGTRERRRIMNGKILIIKHASNEGPGHIRTFFEGQGWPIELVDFSNGDVLPNNLDGVAAVVLLGGPMNVYEEKEYPFLKKEDNFIGRLIIEEIPFIGICLGAQLLAKACQGRVFKSNTAEIGWYTVNLTKEGRHDTLFYGLSAGLTVFQWHERIHSKFQKEVRCSFGAEHAGTRLSKWVIMHMVCNSILKQHLIW
jgi:GMP synthase-like glutamine amidotransferase